MRAHLDVVLNLGAVQQELFSSNGLPCARLAREFVSILKEIGNAPRAGATSRTQKRHDIRKNGLLFTIADTIYWCGLDALSLFSSHAAA